MLYSWATIIFTQHNIFGQIRSDNSDDCNDENDGDYDGYDCDNDLNDHYS